MDKAEVARRQLGTALHMFLRKLDPVSVHTLATAGAEIAERLVELAGYEPFKNVVLDANPNMDIVEFRRKQRQYSNAFKHATTQNGHDRQDEEILERFDESANEATLLVGWYDYGMARLPRPIEAHAFEAWFFEKHSENSFPGIDIPRIFPNITSLSPDRQHTLLIDSIRRARKRSEIMENSNIDRRSLIMP